MTSPDPEPQPTQQTGGPRRRLPATKTGTTHKFSIAGFEGYLTANAYDDGALGELFINDVGKEGSTLRGVLAMFAILECSRRDRSGMRVAGEGLAGPLPRVGSAEGCSTARRPRSSRANWRE